MLVGCLMVIAAFLGLPVGFFLFTDFNSPQGFIIMIISLLIIIGPMCYAYSIRKNINNYNENNDGIFAHYCSIEKPTGLKIKKEIYEIIIDTNKRTVFLRSDEREKTFSFSDIQSWKTSIIQDSQLNQGFQDNVHKGGLFITTNELGNPIWQIKFLPEKGNSLEQQYKSWMNILNRTLNG